MNAYNLHSQQKLLHIFDLLLSSFGPRHWWPAETGEEVILGAILAQNTSWSNAQKALAALRSVGTLSFQSIDRMDTQALSNLIRPARFMNQKARTLKIFSAYFRDAHSFSLESMKRADLQHLRTDLLSLHGIGPETADSILLYALDRPIFVIDAYTKRIFSRHGFQDNNDSYDSYQQLFMDNLPHDVRLYNEYHALLVHTGYLYCKPAPQCERCPLAGLREHYYRAQRQNEKSAQETG